MRASIATAIIIIIFSVFSLAAGQQSRGVVTGITVTPGPIAGNFRFAISGSNPCAAVQVDFGDASNHTYPIAGLPDNTTVWHHYTLDGSYVVRATGANDCGGAATTRVNVTLPPDPRPNRPAVEPPPPPRPAIRFSPMDHDGDGVVTRAEWRGSAASFAFHDWNRNNQLEGEEVRFGAPRPATTSGQIYGSGKGNQGQNPQSAQNFDWFDWSESQFRALDRNRDNRLSVPEWRYDLEHFVRVDRDGNSVLTLDEFLISDIDDDRGDRFVNLDLNRDGRLDRDEWHGHPNAFRWLDRNGDGVVARAEVASPIGANAGGQVPQGVGRGVGQSGGNVSQGGIARTVVINGRQAWSDTGIDVLAGDVLSVQATGTILFSKNSRDVAVPDGARGRPATARAPMPDVFIGALIARIGTGAPFFVGAEPQGLRASHSGRLYLGVNDDVLNDNSGEFRARVTVERGPNR